jgi:hypothetical protein
MGGVRMFFLGTQAGRKGRAALAACALAGLAAATGCTSGGGQPSQAGGQPSQAGGRPSWAGALGPNVTVDPPRPASAGDRSPQGVVIGVAAAFTTGHFVDLCKYQEPWAGCTSAWGSPNLRSEVDLADYPTFENLKIGYTAIDGDKALVGFTGTVCVLKDYPSCFTNENPAAVLDTGKSFSALWSQSLTSQADVASLSPAIKINGNWYAYTVNDSIVMF